jgi:uncharacterized protein YfbU (UPF0304 family)
MELSKKDRLILINQYKILSILNPDESERYANYIRTLELGFELNYDIMAAWLTDGMSEEECAEVVDILEMYRCLNHSFSKLRDKSGINRRRLEFPGFDAEEEEKQLGYMEYLLYSMNKFKEFRKRGRNPDHDSRQPMLDRYRAMLRVWESYSNKKLLDKNEIIDILDGEEREEQFITARLERFELGKAERERNEFERTGFEKAEFDGFGSEPDELDEAETDKAERVEAELAKAEAEMQARMNENVPEEPGVDPGELEAVGQEAASLEDITPPTE